MIGTLTHRSWMSMRQRCLDKKHHAYNNYGGRWITICDRWLESFQNFYDDMGERENTAMTLDRIDTNGNYEPSNCKWSTKSQQSRNTRRTRFFEWDKIVDMSDKLQIPYHLLYTKLWKLSIESMKLVTKYWHFAVVQKDKNWNTIKIYKDAVSASKETWILHSSITKCCNKKKYAITAWWYKWDYLLPERKIEDNREKLKVWRPKKIDNCLTLCF